MRHVLLDENMPRKLTRLFGSGVEAVTVGQRGWKGKQNGALLKAAQDEFDVFITTDRGIPHQQNLSAFKMGFVLMEVRSNRYNDLAPLMRKVEDALEHVEKGQVIRVTA